MVFNQIRDFIVPDPDPHLVNADPHPWMIQSIQIHIRQSVLGMRSYKDILWVLISFTVYFFNTLDTAKGSPCSAVYSAVFSSSASSLVAVGVRAGLPTVFGT